MPKNTSLPTPPAAAAPPRIINGRFGPVAVTPDTAVALPNGLLGFGNHQGFALGEIDDPRYAQFRVLQSLDDDDLAFLVLPLDPDAGLIDRDDLAQACAHLVIDRAHAAILLIATIRKAGGVAQASINLRAPLFIDTRRGFGVQYVLPNEAYPIRYILARSPAAP